jgi:hypothetical protein
VYDLITVFFQSNFANSSLFPLAGVFIHRWATTEPQKMALFAFVGYVSQGTALNQLALAISRFTAIVFFSKISKVQLGLFCCAFS